MSATCFLDTDGYRISFSLKAGRVPKSGLDMVVELTLHKHIGDLVVKSVPMLIDVKDLHRLSEYFRAHIVQLLQTPDHASHTFVPMGLGFQVQALAGDIQAENDGEFTVRFLLNVGQSGEERHRVYIGGESVVSLTKIKRFTSSLDDALAALSEPDRVGLAQTLP